VWRCCPRKQRRRLWALRLLQRARRWPLSWGCAPSDAPCERSCRPRLHAGYLRSGLGCVARRRWSCSGWLAAGWLAHLWRRPLMGGQMTLLSQLLGDYCGAKLRLYWTAKPPWQRARSSPSSCLPVLGGWRCGLPVVVGGNVWCPKWSASSRWPRCLVPACSRAG